MPVLHAVAVAILFAVPFGPGRYSRHEIRTLIGVSEYKPALTVLSPVVAGVMFAVLLAIGHDIRALYHWTARILDRWIGQRAANVVGWVLVAGLVYTIVSGVLLTGFIDAADTAFSASDDGGAIGWIRPWWTPCRPGTATGTAPSTSTPGLSSCNPRRSPPRASTR